MKELHPSLICRESEGHSRSQVAGSIVGVIVRRKERRDAYRRSLWSREVKSWSCSLGISNPGIVPIGYQGVPDHWYRRRAMSQLSARQVRIKKSSAQDQR